MPEHGARHRFTGMGAAHGHEDRIGLMPCQQLRARMGQIALQPVVRHVAEGHQPLLAALAGDAQHAIIQADMEELEPHQFAHAQAAGVKQLQHGAITQPQGGGHIRCGQQGLHLRLAQALGHAQRLPGSLQAQGGILLDAMLAHGPAVVALEHRQPAVGCRRLAAGGEQMPLVEVDGRFGYGIQRARRLLRLQPLRKQRQIAPVSRERVGRQAILQPQGIDKCVNSVGLLGRQGVGCALRSGHGRIMQCRWPRQERYPSRAHPIRPRKRAGAFQTPCPLPIPAWRAISSASASPYPPPACTPHTRP